MGMLQKILNLKAGMGRATETGSWAEDPLSHPDIMAMDARQIADLPLSPFPPLPDCDQLAKRPASAP